MSHLTHYIQSNCKIHPTPRTKVPLADCYVPSPPVAVRASGLSPLT